MSTTPVHCPVELQHAFCQLLTETLLMIRNDPGNVDRSYLLADRMHNVPALLDNFKVELLRYDWEVERPCFLDSLDRIGEPPPVAIEEQWKVIEREYCRLCNHG